MTCADECEKPHRELPVDLSGGHVEPSILIFNLHRLLLMRASAPSQLHQVQSAGEHSIHPKWTI